MLESLHVCLSDGLNPCQHEAVFAPFENSILVLAGAGCGKTTVLSKRIAFCAATFCKPEHILALTFTKKAALEMKTRVEALLKDTIDYKAPSILTFHALCFRIISTPVSGQTPYKILGYLKTPTLITAKERLSMISCISSPAEREIFKTDLLGLDALIQKQSVNPNHTTLLSKENSTLLDTLIDRTLRYKKHMGQWDFSDMIQNARTVLVSNPSIKNYYQTYFKSILVDEFQDTNPLQIDLLKLLRNPVAPLFAVGDDDQAIYGFLGADPSIINQFEDTFGSTKIIKLEINYRSVAPILTVANKIFSTKELRFRKILIAAKSKKHFRISTLQRRPQILTYQDPATMFAGFSVRLAALLKSNIPLIDIVFLVRTNFAAEYLKKRFTTLVEKGEMHAVPQCITIHAAKGLEWPVVFLCDCDEGGLPYYRLPKKRAIHSIQDFLKALFTHTPAPISPENLAEEKRLFYVGVTRAQTHLFCITCKKRLFFDKLQKTKPSRFLAHVSRKPHLFFWKS